MNRQTRQFDVSGISERVIESGGEAGPSWSPQRAVRLGRRNLSGWSAL